MKLLTTNILVYEPLIKWCLEKALKLKNYYLIIDVCSLQDARKKRYIPKKLKNSRLGGASVSKHIIWINRSHLKDVCWVISLFHEIRHYYQRETNMFPDMNTIVLPEVSDFNDIRSAYEKFPWEQDARKFAEAFFMELLHTKKRIYYPNVIPR